MLLEIDLDKFKDFVIGEGYNKVLCARMLKVTCGMLMDSALYCDKFRNDIEAEGHQINQHGICVVEEIIKGKQHVLAWHVNDAKSSHVGSKVNDEFCE